MSLLTTASPWINDDSNTPKRRPSTMRKTIKMPYINSNEEVEEYRTGETKEQYNNNFMENYQNLEPSNIETTQKVNESRGSKINDLLNKMSLSTDNDGGKLGNFTPPPNPILNNKKPDISGKSANGELLPTDLLPKNNLQPNVKPLFQNNGIASGMGYVFYYRKKENKVYVWEYQIKRDRKQPNSNKTTLNLIFGNSPEDITLSSIIETNSSFVKTKNYTTLPVFEMQCNQDFPMEQTIVPIMKRKIMAYIFQILNVNKIKNFDSE